MPKRSKAETVHLGVRIQKPIRELIDTAALMRDQTASEWVRSELRKAAVRQIAGGDAAGEGTDR